MSIDQLVLPSHCRKTILSLAHEIPLAGHLGQKKTAERILQRFYWPTLFQDVREVCKACPECQRTASGKTVRAPMIPLPIIEEPFQRIAMDIVGPLPRSRQGHREVPQASTGFSPFELVYGRQVRGPLDIIKESWEADKRSNESVVSHVLTVQDRLSKMSELARENLRKAQTVQKRWYDKNSRERTFQAGEQVLVLLPSTTNKLLAQWQGPYPVIRKITPVTYEVDMFDHKKPKRMFHVNMLKKWNIPTLALWTESKNGTDETEDDLPAWKDDTDPKEASKMGPQLANEQRSELQELL